MTQFYSRIDTEFNGDVYNIPFSYSKESEISIYLDDELFTDWYFLNESQIKFTELPSKTPEIVTIRRTTDITKKVVEYTNNTMLSKEALNLSQDQLLNAIQEIYDNNIVFKLDSTNQIATNKADTDAQIKANKQDTDNQITTFKADINATIEEVTEAANKINKLEEAVAEAKTSANTATSAANNAEIAANTATTAAQNAAETANTVAGALETKQDVIADLEEIRTGAALGATSVQDVSDKLNKSQITNCILEAPNGVATISGGTFTAKQGLKVLIPNGRNADGSLKNIEYTLENDLVRTFGDDYGSNNRIYSIYLFIGGDKESGPLTATIRMQDCYILPTAEQDDNRIIYNITDNKFYWTTKGTPNWLEVQIVVIGQFIKSNNVYTMQHYEPISLLKQRDKSQISCWSMPSSKYTTSSIGASGSKYTAPANGWFACDFSLKQTSASGVMWAKMINQSAGYAGDLKFFTNSTEFEYMATLPVKKGDVISIQYQAPSVYVASWEYGLRFIYAEGVKE